MVDADPPPCFFENSLTRANAVGRAPPSPHTGKEAQQPEDERIGRNCAQQSQNRECGNGVQQRAASTDDVGESADDEGADGHADEPKVEIIVIVPVLKPPHAS